MERMPSIFSAILQKNCNTIILGVINCENKGHAMNEGHLKTHEWLVKALVLRHSTAGGSILDIYA